MNKELKESAWEMFRELIKNNQQLVFETFNLGWDNLPPEKEAMEIMNIDIWPLETAQIMFQI